MVVAKEEEAGAMKLVAAGTSCNIHRPACSCPGAQIEVGGGDLEFLHGFLRKPHRRSAISDFHDAATVHGDAGSASVKAHWGAQQGNQGSISAYLLWLLRSGFELGQLQEVPSIERQSLDLRTADHALDLMRLIANLRRGALHGQAFGVRADLH